MWADIKGGVQDYEKENINFALYTRGRYVEEVSPCLPINSVQNGVVWEFSAHSEKPEDIWEIGRVHRVHPPLYKYSIGVRGTFMAPNGNNLRTKDPMK